MMRITPLGRRGLLLGGAAALAGGPARAAEAGIAIEDFAFVPQEARVAAGTRVVWTNRDDSPHTVVGTEGADRLRSPPLDTDDRFAFTFAVPGSYRYFCSLHPHMQGIVIVG